MAAAPFYEAGRLSQLAITLFHGWGYNFYRLENQLRADDLLVRARVCDLLAASHASVANAEALWRRQHLPPPTREHPRPDPASLLDAQMLETIGRELGALEGQIRALPAPESDRMSERFRAEAATLSRLAEADEAMAGHAGFLRELLADADGAWVLEHAQDIRASLGAVRTAVQSRSDLLTP